jgi:hypothetical protein
MLLDRPCLCCSSLVYWHVLFLGGCKYVQFFNRLFIYVFPVGDSIIKRGWIAISLIGLTKSNVCVCLNRGWIAIPLIGLTKSNVCVCLKRGWIAIPLIGLTKSNVCVCLKRGWITIPLIGLTKSNVCACLKPGVEIPTFYVIVFSYVQ